jgi:putative ABC transport system permease protein
MRRPSGGLRSALIVGIQGIRARKLRTLLSMISLFLGVLAVVIVQASAETADRAATADIELTAGKDGTRQGYLPADQTVVPIILDTTQDRPGVVLQLQSGAIIGEPRVSPVNPGAMPFDDAARADLGPQTRYECGQRGCVAIAVETGPRGSAVELRLIGLTADIRQFRPFRPVSGQWLDFTSAPSLAPRIVLNREAAKGLSRHRVPAEMRITGAPVNPTPRVIGVVDDGEGSPNAYVRADELLNWLPEESLGDGSVGLLLLAAPDADDTFRILKARVAAAGGDPNLIQYEVIQSRAQVDTQLVVLRWIFLGLAALVLLIGVAGILNVGLATVGERVEEFALRRAVGTPRSLLAAIVLAETLITGLLTAGVAIGVVALGLRLLGRYLQGRLPIPLDTSVPWQAAVAGIVAGLVAGLLGGLIPAVRAARIPIATVMRA